jgi:hypothetical protein
MRQRLRAGNKSDESMRVGFLIVAEQLSENRKYQRTHVTFTVGSNWRFLNSGGRRQAIPNQATRAGLFDLQHCPCNSVR